MTVEQYLNEHDPREGQPERHCCAYCGEEIERGWPQWSDGKDFLHAECFLEWAVDTFSVDDIAYGLNFAKEVAP